MYSSIFHGKKRKRHSGSPRSIRKSLCLLLLSLVSPITIFYFNSRYSARSTSDFALVNELGVQKKKNEFDYGSDRVLPGSASHAPEKDPQYSSGQVWPSSIDSDIRESEEASENRFEESISSEKPAETNEGSDEAPHDELVANAVHSKGANLVMEQNIIDKGNGTGRDNIVDWDKVSNEELSAHIRWVRLERNRVQKDRISGIEFYWQLPLPQQSNLRGRETESTRAILFVAHACKQSAVDWFSSLSRRSPEEAAIVQLARHRGAMIVAMSSMNHQNGCWEFHDGPRIAQVLQHMESRQAQIAGTPDFPPDSHIPLFAFGSSTGAILISSYLPKAFESYVGPGGPAIALDGIIVQNVGARLNPKMPAVYITLSREEKEHEQLDSALMEYSGLAEHIELPIQRMTRAFLGDRITHISKHQSENIYELMVEAEILDPYTGELTEDPKYSQKMQRVLSKISLDSEDLVTAVIETLMVVWGKQATTRDGVDIALDWLLGRVK